MNRLPDGTVYEVLSTKDGLRQPTCFGIPQVCLSGILVKDINGYQLEYLLMEDCSVTIVKYIDDIAGEAKKCIKNILQMLAEARHVSVLHHDISAGNIAIKDGHTCH